MSRYWVEGVNLPNLKQPPVKDLRTFWTPTDKVFLLNHVGVPRTDGAERSIAIKGLVARETTIAIDDLRGMPQHEVAAFHECAGHPLHPTVAVRRVANVVWKGVPLKHVLAKAGVRPEARFVWSAGADGGDYHGIDIPAFVKDLPIGEAERGDVMLALQMNGADLDAVRGGPVRLVVPGYYGTNSTKWLVGLDLQPERSPGYFTTVMYNDRRTENGREIATPVWRVAPHSIIVEPAHAQQLVLGRESRIRGWAWGADPIRTVEVSTDGGATWIAAKVEPRVQHSWQEFSLAWSPTSAGDYCLRCRAIDEHGRGQPHEDARNSVFSIDVCISNP
ncbi:molybdopterin-dependent oxidoreductase [Bosea lathyri]|uniref:DMSO/TMAO reductase YedYZ, molybdopterin-dependent catalytic subunit n=1 Tax=Bosea lathyri TaxID=1036778 RepID=A0A1H6D8V7_9HYPH|nr:molybdopterin-dependent oxidoreductase [Bosea lathyri]SEG81761.1 DMSO/TMAO reductase YedYZ, molybdopterin-dependent catalytic subunit [Bosea lathyri]